MSVKASDVIAVGSCYFDVNLFDYPFDGRGIPVDTELAGGAYETVAGGSAVAFCRLLSKLGTTTGFIGMAGQDYFGDALERSLREEGVEPLLIRRPDLQTNLGWNATNPDGEHVMLVGGTANAALSAEGVTAKLTETLSQANLLFLGGCFKLKRLMPGFADIAAETRRQQVKLVVDHNRIPEGTSNEHLDIIRQLALAADYYLPSRKEFCQLWEVDIIEDGLQKLAARQPTLTVIVKDGANGAYFWAEGDVQHVPAPRVDKVQNVTSAGDTFNAGVIAALTQEKPLEPSVAFGCQLAAAKIAGQALPFLK